MNKKGELYCAGCGVKLQYTDLESIGYIPKSALETSTFPYCKRCHDLRYHNTIMEIHEGISDASEVFKIAAKSKGIIVFVIDIFNFKSSIKEIIEKELINHKFILVLNKSDVLPKAVKSEKIIAWAQKRFIKSDNIIKIILTSAKKNYNIDDLTKTILDHRNGQDVYFLGITNAGKSSLINAFLKTYKNETENLVTTSFYPNTTLKIIEIPLDNRSFIYDTPGLQDDSSMYNFLESKLFKQIIPKKEIKPRSYQLKEPQAFYLGNLARIDILANKKASLIMYFSDFLQIHRCKCENNEEKFQNLIKSKQLNPLTSKITSLNDFVIKEIILEDKIKIDIIIYGLGFITLNNCENTKILLHLPKGVNAEVIESLI